MNNIIICGSSGFIGNALVKKFQEIGKSVIGIDIEEPKYAKPALFYKCDLRDEQSTKKVFKQIGYKGIVYNLACLMGGMGYIGDEQKSHDILIGSTQIVINVINACIEQKVKKVFYSSSACVYNMNKQNKTHNVSLSESDAYPAMPDLEYGWQKLISERMHHAAYVSNNLDYAIARFHNIFGPEGTWKGGKEKAPAALCRKVAMAKDGDYIDVWGDGKQTRSFLYIDECLEGVERLMNSDCKEPLNIGSDEMVSINQLAQMIIDISGKDLRIKNISGNVGVMGRNSDNNKIENVLGWKPSAKLHDGLVKTYEWILSQVNKQ